MKLETPQLVLFDLDGTLLDSEGVIRPRNLDVLHALIDRGVAVGISTGRSLRSAAPFIELVRPTGPLVLLHGCVLRDPRTDETLIDRRLGRRDAFAVVRAALELGIQTCVYLGDEIFVQHGSATSSTSAAKERIPHTEVADLAALVVDHPDEPYKVLCIDDRAEFSRALLKLLDDTLDPYCTIVNSAPTHLEILPPAVYKGCHVSEIEARFRVDASDIIAFGDEMDDVELLRAVGHAVVMGNCNRRLRRLVPDAYYIGSNDSDAIADFLVARFSL